MCLLRSNLYILMVLTLMLISSCATLSELGLMAEKNEWDSVPKSYVEGLKAARKGDAQLAIQYFSATTEEFPGFPPAFTNLGLQQLKLKHRDAAKQSFNKAIQLKANNSVAYQHLGIIYRIDGEFSQAQSMYEKALEFDADNALAHFNLGILLDIYLYDLQTALVHYEKYQALKLKKDATVANWIIDIKRRIKKKNL